MKTKTSNLQAVVFAVMLFLGSGLQAQEWALTGRHDFRCSFCF